MASSVVTVINALAPIVLLMAAGAACRAFLMPNDNEWDDIHKLTYYVLLPALIISKLTQASAVKVSLAELAVVTCTAQFIMFVATFISFWQEGHNKENFCALMQHNLLINGYVSISVAQAYFGDRGAVLSMVALAFTVPVANILGLWTLHMWGNPNDSQEKLTFTGIMRSAPAVACLIGFWLYQLKMQVPAAIMQPIALLGDAGLPLGLMAAGAGIRFSAFKEWNFTTASWIVMRLLLFPTLVYLMCWVFGIRDVLVVGTCVATACAPTAAWGYVHVKRFGGDAAYAALLIVLSTMAAFLTIPIVMLSFFRYAVMPL